MSGKPTRAVIEKALQELTTTVEIGGAALGFGRNKAYELAKSGSIAGCPVIAEGKSKRMPTAPIRKRLGLEASDAGRVA